MTKIKSKIDSKALGSIIKINRVKQKMSQRELAKGICVHSYLSKIENGEIVATGEIIKNFFDALSIDFDDSESFITEGRRLFKGYMEALRFGDFELSNELYEKIEEEKEKYLHSSMVINYYFAMLARRCSTKDRESFEEAKYLLESVIDNMDSEQKSVLYTYEAIDIMHISTDYAEAISLLNKVLEYGESAQAYYWLSVCYLKTDNLIKATNYAYQALQLYVKEVNLNNVMSSYELMGRINMCNEYYEEGIYYFSKAHKVCRKLKDNKPFEGYLFNKIAWCNMCLGNEAEAFHYINQDLYSENMIPKLSPNCVKLFIYFMKEDKSNVEKIYRQIDWNSNTLYKLLHKFFEKYLREERYLYDKGVENILLEIIKSSANLLEVRKFFEKKLIIHYKYNRRYKEIVDIYEKNNETNIKKQGLR